MSRRSRCGCQGFFLSNQLGSYKVNTHDEAPNSPGLRRVCGVICQKVDANQVVFNNLRQWCPVRLLQYVLSSKNKIKTASYEIFFLKILAT